MCASLLTSGEYKDATISRWASDAAKLIDKICSEKGVEKVTMVGVFFVHTLPHAQQHACTHVHGRTRAIVYVACVCVSE